MLLQELVDEQCLTPWSAKTEVDFTDMDLNIKIFFLFLSGTFISFCISNNEYKISEFKISK